MRRDISGAKSPSPSPGFQCQEVPQISGCSGEWVSGRNFWSPKQFLLKNPHTHLIRLTPSELQHWGWSLKGTRDIQGRTEVSSIKARVGGQLSSRQKGGDRPLSLFWVLPSQNHRDSINLANTVCPALDVSWGSVPPNSQLLTAAFLHTLVSIWCCQCLDLGYSCICLVVPHYGFNLYSSDVIWYKISFHMLKPSVYLCWWGVY